MKKFIAKGFGLLLVIGIALFFFSPKNPNSSPALPFFPQPVKFSNLEFNGNIIKAEVADTSDKRKKGLGGRQSLDTNTGMLFIFEKADKYPFWMKGLSFPLDFIWIKGDTVLDILTNVQPPLAGQKDDALAIYSSKEPVDKVLEVNGGTVDRLGIKTGDVIKITPQ